MCEDNNSDEEAIAKELAQYLLRFPRDIRQKIIERALELSKECS